MFKSIKIGIIATAVAGVMAGSAFAKSTALDFPNAGDPIGDSDMVMTQGAFDVFMDENGEERTSDDSMAMFGEATEEDQSLIRNMCSMQESDTAGFSDHVKETCTGINGM